MKKKKIIFYFYNRLLDPLLQSNIFLFINEIGTHGEYEIAVITYEDELFPVTLEQRALILGQFEKLNIQWYPLKWNKGTNLYRKGIDLFTGIFTILQLRLAGYKHLVSLGSLAGSFGYVACFLLRVKLYLYQYEPHSEYAVDNGIWLKDSKQFKMLHFLEKRSALYATVISTGTDRMIKRLHDWNAEAAVFKIPSVADDKKFVFSSEARNKIRLDLSIPEQSKVIVYPGKFGELYYAEELIGVFDVIRLSIPNTFFLVITGMDKELIRGWFSQKGMPVDCYRIVTANYTEMPDYLSAADLGIVSVRPGKSSIFRSNIKTGEYLCTGLPYLVCKDVSEDDRYALRDQVGVVVDDFSPDEIARVIPEIRSFLELPLEIRIEKCRKSGLEYRGYTQLKNTFKLAIEKLTGS